MEDMPAITTMSDIEPITIATNRSRLGELVTVDMRKIEVTTMDLAEPIGMNIKMVNEPVEAVTKTENPRTVKTRLVIQAAKISMAQVTPRMKVTQNLQSIKRLVTLRCRTRGEPNLAAWISQDYLYLMLILNSARWLNYLEFENCIAELFDLRGKM